MAGVGEARRSLVRVRHGTRQDDGQHDHAADDLHRVGKRGGEGAVERHGIRTNVREKAWRDRFIRHDAERGRLQAAPSSSFLEPSSMPDTERAPVIIHMIPVSSCQRARWSIARETEAVANPRYGVGLHRNNCGAKRTDWRKRYP